MTRRPSAAFAAIVGLLVANVAGAQTPPAAEPNPSTPVPRDTQPRQPNPPISPDENLSDKLGESNGVLTPPPTDQGIHAPAPVPNPDSKDVIPPPGTPGGDPSIEPK